MKNLFKDNVGNVSGFNIVIAIIFVLSFGIVIASVVVNL